MDAEKEILLFKRKVADRCIVLLMFLFVFGMMQIFNHYKQKSFSLETKVNVIKII